MDNQLLTVFVGIIALCSIFISVIIILIGFHTLKTMKQLQEVVTHLQNELSFLSTKVALTLHEVNELINHLKVEIRSISDKSKLSLHELHELISFVHDETKSLAIKASNGIAKVTIGSLAIGALSQILKKKTKE
ncbi:hypothetical protein [Sulfuricurvum sp.]|uniref:hypothetical protein n=1 Tax=Sulfuricurvum sp. TaxID=2025608 RepID=UPI0019945DEA|nr:hypothetical protein [Sulfuricurvum sp.]MBD3799309.1 hypothetical protein [Campylobacterota bacterium]MBD3806180.1 hypothetical protein [Sulfuricurvum sp.]